MTEIRKGISDLKKDLLFEIGTEELPATNLADLFESAMPVNGRKETSLESKLKKALEDHRLSFRECRVGVTPRRLVFHVEGVSGRQAPKEHFVRGPARQDAYGPDGKPTEKLLGFLKSKNASPNHVEIQAHQGKDYVYVRQSEIVKPLEAVLPDLLKNFVQSLSFPKNMRWDSSGFYFPRPIRHLLCFCGAKPLRFALGGLTSSDRTVFFFKGERKTVRVKSIPDYYRQLRKNGVEPDPEKRKKEILGLLDRSAAGLKGRLYEDPFLLGEVNFLVECPDSLCAPFAEEFLSLPMEVLTVSMARKQRLFGVLDPQGRVLPRFLAVMDGVFSAADKKKISKNYEEILRAKLQDSLFFYKEDTKVPLLQKREELRGLAFLKGAGSMFDKSERLLRLARALGARMGLADQDRKTLERAALLCKADLLTHMVGEFPELQGIMGRYYAGEAGESRDTALAVGEHYLPRTAQGPLPETPAGCVLSILDKSDLLTASFLMGLEPTSSLDPYGLRRSATAVVRIAVDRSVNFSLADLLNHCRKELGGTLQKAAIQKTEESLTEFFKDRFRAVMVDRGFAAEWVDAVTASRFDDMREAAQRLAVLSHRVEKEDFERAWKVVERTANILRSAKEPLLERVKPEHLTEELERRVYEQWQAGSAPIREATRARDFKRATHLYAEAFFAILGEFFEKVFVNAENPEVRRNRLALLREVRDLYTKDIADLSKIHLKI
jgi:glycyl-tRNA synthetase beta chain